MSFLGSFIQYAVVMIILAAVAMLGIGVGKVLRERKNKKASEMMLFLL